jgi:hypothetical protein
VQTKHVKAIRPAPPCPHFGVGIQLLLPCVDEVGGVLGVAEEEQACRGSTTLSQAGHSMLAVHAAEQACLYHRTAGPTQIPSNASLSPPMFMAEWMDSSCSRPSSPLGLEGVRSSEEARMSASGYRSKYLVGSARQGGNGEAGGGGGGRRRGAPPPQPTPLGRPPPPPHEGERAQSLTNNGGYEASAELVHKDADWKAEVVGSKRPEHVEQSWD